MRLLKISAILGLLGCMALLVAYWAPAFQPGSVRGADIGRGLVFLLGLLLGIAGIGTALWGVVAAPGTRRLPRISAPSEGECAESFSAPRVVLFACYQQAFARSAPVRTDEPDTAFETASGVVPPQSPLCCAAM